MVIERKKEEEKAAAEFIVKRKGENLGKLTEEWAERLETALEREDIHEQVHEAERKKGSPLTLAEIMQILEELLDPIEEAREDQRFLEQRTFKRSI